MLALQRITYVSVAHAMMPASRHRCRLSPADDDGVKCIGGNNNRRFSFPVCACVCHSRGCHYFTKFRVAEILRRMACEKVGRGRDDGMTVV